MQILLLTSNISLIAFLQRITYGWQKIDTRKVINRGKLLSLVPMTHLERVHHGPGERFRVLLAGEVQAVHELGVPPLVERRRGLVVLEPLDDRAVDDDLVVLQLAADHSECVVLLVVEDLHLAEAGRAARRDPLLLAIVVHHHRCPGTDYALLAACEK